MKYIFGVVSILMLGGCAQSDDFNLTCEITRSISDNGGEPHEIQWPHKSVVFKNHEITNGLDSARCQVWTSENIECTNIVDKNNEDTFLYNRKTGEYSRVGKGYDSRYEVMMEYRDIGTCKKAVQETKSDVDSALNAKSKWVKMDGGFYLLESINARSVFLMASTDTNTNKAMVSILKTTNEVCKNDGTSYSLGEHLYKANGELVQVSGMCINGNQVEVPTSESGKGYLVMLAEQPLELTVQLENSKVARFNPIGFQQIRSSLDGQSGVQR